MTARGAGTVCSCGGTMKEWRQGIVGRVPAAIGPTGSRAWSGLVVVCSGSSETFA